MKKLLSRLMVLILAGGMMTFSLPVYGSEQDMAEEESIGVTQNDAGPETTALDESGIMLEEAGTDADMEAQAADVVAEETAADITDESADIAAADEEPDTAADADAGEQAMEVQEPAPEVAETENLVPETPAPEAAETENLNPETPAPEAAETGNLNPETPAPEVAETGNLVPETPAPEITETEPDSQESAPQAQEEAVSAETDAAEKAADKEESKEEGSEDAEEDLELFADTNSGTFGGGLTWVLSEEGTLTISGNGAIPAYSSYRYTPWYPVRESIQSIKLKSGITRIGEDAFAHLINLVSFQAASGLQYIGEDAFEGCTSLTTVYIPASVTKIGEEAFEECYSLSKVVYAGTKTEWGLISINNSERGNQYLLDAQKQFQSEEVVSVKPEVILSATSYVYDGTVKTPSVTVKVNGQKLSSSEYKVSRSSGRTKVGVYRVKVTLKGAYSGSKTVKFKILPKGTSVSKVTGASGSVTVKWKKQSKQTSGYEIQYSYRKNFDSAKTVTVTNVKKVSRKISGLKSGKTCYVRIRTYKTVNGKKYYSDWSSVKKAKVQ